MLWWWRWRCVHFCSMKYLGFYFDVVTYNDNHNNKRVDSYILCNMVGWWKSLLQSDKHKAKPSSSFGKIRLVDLRFCSIVWSTSHWDAIFNKFVLFLYKKVCAVYMKRHDCCIKHATATATQQFFTIYLSCHTKRLILTT